VLVALIRGSLAVVILAFAVGFFAVLQATKPKPPKAEQQASRLAVSFIEVAPVDAPRVWRAYGTARAKSAANVGVEVPGVIAERPEGIDPGRAVRAGDVLLRLEGREYRDVADQSRARIAAIEADLDALETEYESVQETLALATEAVTLTRSELERYERAQSTAGVNQIELDRLRRQLTEFRRQQEDLQRQVDLIPARRLRLGAQRDQERAALRLAELNLERTEVRAPIDGVLQEVLVDDGERVAPGQTVARIVDLSRIEVPVRAPVSSAPALRVGDRAALSTGGLAPMRWTGIIERIAPEADEGTRTITVYVVVEQEPGASPTMLRPGQYLSASLSSADSEPRIALPRSCIEGDRVVVLDEDDTARFVDVEVAYHLEGAFPSMHPSETQWSVIASGVEPGDRVVIDDPGAIAEGVRLDPVPLGEAPKDTGYATTNGSGAS
jgi:RND family efflux transporter MFP subunit